MSFLRVIQAFQGVLWFLLGLTMIVVFGRDLIALIIPALNVAIQVAVMLVLFLFGVGLAAAGVKRITSDKD